MDKDQRRISDVILNLTLEIIYLLTGEDYGPLKKSSRYHDKLGTQSPNPNPPCSPLTQESSKKILEATKKIFGLLSGEVPIECQDIAVHLSMDDLEYTRHKTNYKDAIMGDEETEAMMGEHRNSKNNGHQNGGFHHDSSKTSYNKGSQNVKNFKPSKRTLEVCGSDQNEESHPNLTSVTKRSRRNVMKSADTDLKEDRASLENCIYETQEESDVDCDEEPSLVEHLHFNLDSIKVELEHNIDSSDKEMHQITETNTVKTLNVTRALTNDKTVAPFAQAEVDIREGGPAGDDVKLVIVSDLPSCNAETTLSFNDQFDPDEQNQFECSECGECFTRSCQLVEHHRLHSVDKPFACPECGKQFADRAKVVAHQLIHGDRSEPKTDSPEGEGLVLCSECGMGFSNGPALEEHQTVHKQKKAFVCSVCGKSFSRRGHLSNHSRIHTGGKRITDRKYFPHGSYIRKRSFLCPECGKWFPSRSHLDRHQRVHTGEKPFSCTECDRRFTDRSGLVIHLRIHTGEKPYSCDDCGKRFRDRSGLVVHQRNHTGAHPFKCLECGKCFHNRTRLERHMNVHGKQKEFSCPDCDQSFPSVTTLTLHRQTHFGELPPLLEPTRFSPPPSPQTKNPKMFSCSDCGKSFADLSTFSLHMKTHKTGDQQVNALSMPTRANPQQRIITADPSLGLGQLSRQRMQKPYSCSQCAESFSDRKSLLAHEEKHAEEKPYKCPQCGEGFVLKGYLTKHLQTHG